MGRVLAGAGQTPARVARARARNAARHAGVPPVAAAVAGGHPAATPSSERSSAGAGRNGPRSERGVEIGDLYPHFVP